jgi:hypothetical protein
VREISEATARRVKHLIKIGLRHYTTEGKDSVVTKADC